MMLKLLVLFAFTAQNCSESCILDDTTSYYCAREEEDGNCPAEPPNCATIFCTRPPVTWVVNPENPCETLPNYDWSQSCPANSKEPVGYYSAKLIECNPSFLPYLERTGNGQDESVFIDRVCWKWRYCAASCTECSASDGTIPSQSSGASGCVGTFIARNIPLRKAKCDGGAGNGDEELGNQTVPEERCSGPLLPCRPPTVGG